MRFPHRPVLALFLAGFAIPADLDAQRGVEWTVLEPVSTESEGGASFEVARDGSVRVHGANPATDVYTVECVTDLECITAVRLEVLPDPELGGEGPGRSSTGNFVLSELSLAQSPRTGRSPQPVPLCNASADHSQVRWPVSGAVDGLPGTGWGIQPAFGVASTAVFETARDTRAAPGNRLHFTLEFRWGHQHALGRFRLSATCAPRPVRIASEADSWHGMQDRINRAIDAGVSYLLRTQELDGSWSYHVPAYRNGQTALSLYTLLKCGLPAEHPAVQRAVAYLRCGPTTKTYSAGCLLMALCALKDPSHREWIHELAGELESWQRPTGGFAYPEHGVDISNSQYAALGLWVAAHAGAEISQRTWELLARRTIQTLQEEAEGAYASAGFRYHPGGAVTGSRTAAGVGILAICAEQLDEARARRVGIPEAKRRGLEWLARHFSANSNPLENNNSWTYYYLYGVERVGALTGLAHLGGSDWYREGARHMVDVQGADGSWDTAANARQANTCFVLLFLRRATAPTSGASPRRARTWGGDDPTAEVSLRGSGDTPMAIWISSFGEGVLADCEWPGEEGRGLRIERVEYLLPEEALVPDGRSGDVTWRWTDRRPAEGWQAPDFRDTSWELGAAAFGRESGAEAVVRTRWEGAELWLRRELELDPVRAVEPVLELNFSDAFESREPSFSGPPLVCLYDEDPAFATALSWASESSEAREQQVDAHHGASALTVTPVQRHSPNILGWDFKIRRDPGPGEYRYLRFAWKKRGGEGIMLQLADDGSWTDSSLRYYAGSPGGGMGPAIALDDQPPERWTVVTRDLHADHGGDFILTGIAFAPLDGEHGLYDAVWLARSRSDFGAMTRALREREEARAAPAEPAGDGSFAVWLNGRPLLEATTTTLGYEPFETDAPLASLLRPGRNVLAVHLADARPGQVFDLGLWDRGLIAALPGDPERPAGLARFAAQHSFDAPGDYEITARVRVRIPSEDRWAVETRVLESEPLTVRIEDAVDPELLSYASDPGRNLLARAGVRATASSQLGGWPATHAVDNLQCRAWLADDGDREPTLSLYPNRTLRADTLLLSHARADRDDAERSTRIQRVEVTLNSKGPVGIVDMVPDDWKKTVWSFPKPVNVRRVQLRVLETSGGHPTKSAVGFAEVELQLRGR